MDDQLWNSLKKNQAAAKNEGDAKVLAFQKKQAAAGSAHYEYVLGLRYATGDGVATDLPKARELLFASAALKKVTENPSFVTHSP